MATEQKMPGVYVVERDAFPNSVVAVETSVAAFIGYTEKARDGSRDLTNVPTRITSMAEYIKMFGGAPDWVVAAKPLDETWRVSSARFLMFQSLKLFFDNGGEACMIVSVGGYDGGRADTQADVFDLRDFQNGLAELAKVSGPTMTLCPEAVFFDDASDWARMSVEMLAHCGQLRDRVAILDIRNGDQQPGTSPGTDPIAVFRESIGTDHLDFGMAYYPFLATSVVGGSDVTFANFDPGTLRAVCAAVRAEQQEKADAAAAPGETGEINAQVRDLIESVANAVVAPENVTVVHGQLLALSPIYEQAVTKALEAVNLMPPGPAMAGVFTRVDELNGVWNSPANVALTSVVAPTVQISNDDQGDLNAPLDGKSVNAVRTMAGEGVMVWGARTLDGNSLDWRYISVRRTMIFLEQSIAASIAAYRFEPNTASTWVTVKSMIENFLQDHWKVGVLEGAEPTDAFAVDVGLGSSMTAEDVLNGEMRVTVKVAVIRPAEFLMLTFHQKMQVS